MEGRFQWKSFSEINLDDPFFDTLKADYPGNEHSKEFGAWFREKASEGERAIVYEDEQGLGAFISLKKEEDPIELQDGTPLPAEKRIKIRTLKIDPRYQGQRLGEGALGLAMWSWRNTDRNQIYVTTFDKHEGLIALLERFGFRLIGKNPNKENVYLKDRRSLDYTDPYNSFPFINPEFEYAGYIIIRSCYHDTMFPYSELKNTLQEKISLSVANGLSKIYVGVAPSMPYKIGEPVFIYRKDTEERPGRRYRSCLTSYCVITDIIRAKIHGQPQMSLDDLLQRIGNKSVFDADDIRDKYQNEPNVNVYGMLYYGYFGAGHNVTMDWLQKHGHWAGEHEYPTDVKLSQPQFKEIMKEAKINVENVIIH